MVRFYREAQEPQGQAAGAVNEPPAELLLSVQAQTCPRAKASQLLTTPCTNACLNTDLGARSDSAWSPWLVFGAAVVAQHCGRAFAQSKHSRREASSATSSFQPPHLKIAAGVHGEGWAQPPAPSPHVHQVEVRSCTVPKQGCPHSIVLSVMKRGNSLLPLRKGRRHRA